MSEIVKEAEEKKTALQRCQEEHQQLCFQIGQHHYMIKMYERELNELVEKCKKVNNEASYLQKQLPQEVKLGDTQDETRPADTTH